MISPDVRLKTDSIVPMIEVILRNEEDPEPIILHSRDQVETLISRMPELEATSVVELRDLSANLPKHSENLARIVTNATRRNTQNHGLKVVGQ